jgi:ERF superfamily
MKEITKALLKAQGEFTKIAKDSKNPHFKNDYASLPKILGVVLPILRDNNILLTISTQQIGINNYTNVKLVHVESGEILESNLPILNISDSQKMGSCITYNQRYGLLPLLGISADIDDDGNMASNKDKKSLNEIIAKKQELGELINSYKFEDRYEKAALARINDDNSTVEVLVNAIKHLKRIAENQIKGKL